MKIRFSTIVAIILFSLHIQAQETEQDLSVALISAQSNQYLTPSHLNTDEKSFSLLSVGDSNSVNTQLLLAQDYLRNNQNKEAIEILTSAIHTHPANSHLYFNRALAFMGSGELDNGVNDLKSSLKLNPFHAESHLKLGELAEKQGQLTKAMMCYNAYLLFTDSINPQFLAKYNFFLSTKTTVPPNKITLSKDDYSTIDADINSHKSLYKKYKTPNKIKEAVAKQNHLLLTELTKKELDDGFFNSFYQPFYTQLMKDGKFNNWIYFILRMSESKKVIKYQKKNPNASIEFTEYAFPLWKKLHSDYVEIINNKTQTIHYYWNKDNTFAGKGQVKDQEPVGNFTYYFGAGNISSTGVFDENGEKNGLWITYYPNGKKSKTSLYQSGDVTGSDSTFYANGRVKTITKFENGQPNGIQINYENSGIKSSEVTYLNGVLHGQATNFSSNGNITKESHYLNENLDGKMTEYYPTGAVKTKGFYTNGSKTGIWTNYFLNGQVSSTGEYILGKKTGIWKSYSISGELQNEQIDH